MLHSPSRLTLVPLVALVGLGLAGCSSSSSKKATVSGPAATTNAPTSPTTAGTAGTSMTIAGFKYDPSPLTVAPGTSIPVKNTDGPEHTVTSDHAGLFKADDIKNGMTVSFTAPTKPGTYTFHCEYHSSMHGTLIVK